MDGYGETLTTKMENSRNTLRRIARHDETEFSKESVLSAMEKFMKTVTAMEETVLVPRRLVDLGDGDEAPFALYALLNGLKTDLLWACEGAAATTPAVTRRPASRRTPSSTSGSSCCDSDSEVASLAGSDSGLEGDEVEGEAAQGTGEAHRAAAACRRHLRGLRRSLHRLTLAASDVTRRYQDDVGTPV